MIVSSSAIRIRRPTSWHHRDIATIEYNPFDPAFLANPYPTYARMHEEGRIQRDFFGWNVFGFEPVEALLKDRRMSSVRPEFDLEQLPEAMREPIAVLREHFRLWMLMMDPPSHTRIRKLVSKAFTPRMVEQLTERIEAIADELVAAVHAGAGMDVVRDLAYPLPTRVIAELIGLPPEDAERFKRWSDDLGQALGGGPEAPDRIERQIRGRESLEELSAYLRELIAQRRGRPAEDLLTALIAAEEDGETLSSGELIATCVLLLAAGHETTTGLIGNGTLALLRNRDQLERLRAEPELLPNAIEELLRYDSPVQLTGRMALDDVEIDGVTIAAGDWVTILIGAANHDPSQFEHPDRLDVARPGVKHLSFGHGPHYCIGAALARLEARIAFDRLLWRLPDLELALEDEPEWHSNAVLHGLRALPVAFR